MDLHFHRSRGVTLPHPQRGLGKVIGTEVGRELWAPLAALINASLPTEEPLRPRGVETPLWRHPQGEWGGVPSVSGRCLSSDGFLKNSHRQESEVQIIPASLLGLERRAIITQITQFTFCSKSRA